MRNLGKPNHLSQASKVLRFADCKKEEKGNLTQLISNEKTQENVVNRTQQFRRKHLLSKIPCLYYNKNEGSNDLSFFFVLGVHLIN